MTQGKSKRVYLADSPAYFECFYKLSTPKEANIAELRDKFRDEIIPIFADDEYGISTQTLFSQLLNRQLEVQTEDELIPVVQNAETGEAIFYSVYDDASRYKLFKTTIVRELTKEETHEMNSKTDQWAYRLGNALSAVISDFKGNIKPN